MRWARRWIRAGLRRLAWWTGSPDPVGEAKIMAAACRGEMTVDEALRRIEAL